MIAFLIPEQITELLVLIWRREGEQRFGFLFFLIFDSVLTFFFSSATWNRDDGKLPEQF